MFEKEGEINSEELKRKVAQSQEQIDNEDDDEKSFYYEDPETGEVKKVMISKESHI